MPNVLVLSFEGFSFSSRQLYEQLLPKLLSRAAIYESTTIHDALNYIRSGWPSIILITDPVITADTYDSEQLMAAVAEYTKHGCTTVLAGLFSAAVQTDDLSVMFKEHFDLRWQGVETEIHEVRLVATDRSLIRTASLVQTFVANALCVTRVPPAQMVYSGVYSGSTGAPTTAYAALARVGLGKLGYIGDTGFGEEAERLILAMCHLDRPEDTL